MSEFTPTTEQVRSGYATDPEAEYRNPVNYPAEEHENGRAFDRWLAQHDHEVRVAYEERRKPDPIHIDNIDGTDAVAFMERQKREWQAEALEKAVHVLERRKVAFFHVEAIRALAEALRSVPTEEKP